ncbi:hypothetical protein [Aliivibrio fischeri]|uniref:F4 family fimbrial subunit n=1 Tax=Aliivibrio fischeri TaxID=668 RepID=UPI00080DF2ED|nr:hypothetical protein [Aliivibrio fischeri]OCH43069.1 hypothetical protein A6D99_00375 [Aliivibrio fischeri]
MKKTLLAATILSTLLMSGAASAAFVESPTGFNGQLNFNGTITNTNPVWSWEIPAQSVTDATGWDALVLNGVVNGTNTEFTFPSKQPMTLINGFMKTPSSSGGAGITPVVKIMSYDGTEVEIKGNSPQSIIVTATGKDVNTKPVADGTMEIDAQTFLGGAYGDATSSIYFGAQKAQQVLATNNADFATNYGTPTANTGNYAKAAEDFTNQSHANLSGAYLVEISNYKIAFPSTTLPATWTADIAVTVTLK